LTIIDYSLVTGTLVTLTESYGYKTDDNMKFTYTLKSNLSEKAVQYKVRSERNPNTGRQDDY